MQASMEDIMKLYAATSSFPDRAAAAAFLETDDFVFVQVDSVLEFHFNGVEYIPPAAPVALAQAVRQHVQRTYGIRTDQTIVFSRSNKYQVDWQSIGAQLLAERATVGEGV